MVTIEHNGEKVECSEVDAIKELRKLRAAAKKKEKRDSDNRGIADSRAFVAYAKLVESACGILDEDCGQYLEIATPNSGFGYKHLHVETDFSTNVVYFVAETEHGRKKIPVYGKEIVGCISNGAGFLCAVQLKDKSGEIGIYSIGVSEDIYAMRELPARISKLIVSAAEKRQAERTK